jgi:hypothetical protein
VILSSMISITIVSALILALIYRRYERAMLSFVAWIMQDNRTLAFFMGAILLIPVILMLV